jgi:hypothetical protein
MQLKITSHPFADWFFPAVSVRVLRLLRMALGIVTLAQALVWAPHLREFFTSDGIASASYVRSTTVYSHFSIFFRFDMPWFVYVCFGIYVLACLGVIFGKGGRLASILMWFFFISFVSRFPLVFYGAIDHLHSILFFNMFHPGEAYESWNYGGVKARNKIVNAWSVRMMQLCLCLVYFFAGAQKVRSNTWWNGTELLNSLSTRFGAFDFYWLNNYPVIVNIMSYGSWLSEISFAWLIWNKTTHKISLFAIVGMHLGILVVMNASLFSEIMIASLICFVMPEDEAWIAMLWDRYVKRLLTGMSRSRSLRKRSA